MTPDKTPSADGQQKSINSSRILDKVFTLANEHLLILMNYMLNTADTRLIEQADKVEDEKEKVKYTSCTRIVGKKRIDVSQLFFMNFNKSLAFIPSDEVDKTTMEDEVDLVEHDEMEEMVAITTMHAKAMSLYGDDVNQLEARLEYMDIMSDDLFEKDALNPKRICEVFQQTIENLDMAIEVKLIFYKLFDVEVVEKLGVMYKALNQVFIKNNILPEIILKSTPWTDEPEAEDAAPTVYNYYDPAENVSTDFIPRTKQEISGIINDFMSGDMIITGEELELPASFFRTPEQQMKDGKKCYERKEVIKALSRLQHKLTSLLRGGKGDSLSVEKIKQEMLADIGKDQDETEKEVNVLDERSIDFVGLMFDAISKDSSISDLVTSLITQLQVPVMKLAMIDANLFEDEGHPVRVTIDILTKAGRATKNQEDRLYGELERIVNKILDEFDVELDVFEKAANELKDILFKEEQLARETERKQQKKIMHEHARKIVIAQLKMVTKGKKIPEILKPLILKFLPTHLLKQYVNSGKGSIEWIYSVLLLKLLVKSLQPIQFQSQFNALQNNHKALVEALSDELSPAKQNNGDLTRQIKLVNAYLEKMLEKYGVKFSQEIVSAEPEKVLTEESPESTDTELGKIMQQSDAARYKLSLLPPTTRAGGWFEVYLGENVPVQPLKLSVILENTAQLVFVDGRGLKVIEKNADEFAKELLDNRSRVFDEHSTFDRAVGQVVNSLAV